MLKKSNGYEVGIGSICFFPITGFNNGWAVPVQCDAYQGKTGTMTSERQKAANQANALHSTGPKTEEGKAAVRFNPLRHGLLARDVVLQKRTRTPARTSGNRFGQPSCRWGRSRNFS